MKHPLAALALAVGAVGLSFGAGAVAMVAQNAPAPAAVALAIEMPDDALEARSAILYDLTNGQVLYQKNAQEQLPLASLTKLMAAYAVLAAINPDTVLRIEQADLAPEGDWGLREGDALTIESLLHLGLVASCNDCLAAVVRSLGDEYLAAMNLTARQLGLTRTYFLNPTGLDVSGDTAGAYGSAFDMALLAGDFYKKFPQYFEQSTHPSVSVAAGSRTLSSAATTVPLQDIPGFIGAKTGYTDLAGGNLAAIFDMSIGHPVVAVVLHSSEEGRFKDVRALIDAARTQL